MADSPGGFGSYSVDTIGLKLDLRGKEEIKETEQKVEQLKESVERLGQSAEKTGSRVAGFGQSMLQTGRVVQDFTQGGIAGILNNIEGLSMALGGGAGLAGVLTVLGVAAFVLKPHLQGISEWFTGAKRDVPEAVTEIGRLNDALKANQERLEELKKQQRLNNEEFREYNERTARQIELERDLEAAREREKQKKEAREKLAKSATATEAEAAKERGEILQAALGEQQNELEVDLFRQLGTQGPAAIAQLQQQVQRMPPGEERDNMLRVLTRMRRVVSSKDRFGAVRELEAEAIGGGNLQAIQALTRLLPKGSEFRGILGEATPEAMKASEAEVTAAEQFGQRAHDAGERRRQKARDERERLEAADRVFREGVAAADDVLRGIDQGKAEAKRKENEAKSAARENARRNDPSEQLARMRQADEDAITAQILAENQRTGGTASPEALEAMKRNAMANRAAGASIAQALDQAIWQTRRDIMESAAAEFRRNQAFSETRINQ